MEKTIVKQKPKQQKKSKGTKHTIKNYQNNLTAKKTSEPKTFEDAMRSLMCFFCREVSRIVDG